MRDNHHELVLSDPLTGQVLGHYHTGPAWPKCAPRAASYLGEGAVLQASFVHPDRCGEQQEHCEAGLSEEQVVR